MITKDDIEVYIGCDRVRCTLRVSIEKHYGLHGVKSGAEADKFIMDIVNRIKNDLWREVRHGEERKPHPTGYKSTPYRGP